MKLGCRSGEDNSASSEVFRIQPLLEDMAVTAQSRSIPDNWRALVGKFKVLSIGRFRPENSLSFMTARVRHNDYGLCYYVFNLMINVDTGTQVRGYVRQAVPRSFAWFLIAKHLYYCDLISVTNKYTSSLCSSGNSFVRWHSTFQNWMAILDR